jgi:hypothetical protein
LVMLFLISVARPTRSLWSSLALTMSYSCKGENYCRYTLMFLTFFTSSICFWAVVTCVCSCWHFSAKLFQLAALSYTMDISHPNTPSD